MGKELFGCHNWASCGSGAAGGWRSGVLLKHSRMNKASSTTKNYPDQDVSISRGSHPSVGVLNLQHKLPKMSTAGHSRTQPIGKETKSRNKTMRVFP